MERRRFLQQSLATGIVYVVGSAFQSLDGTLVAGAKTCTWQEAGMGQLENTCWTADPNVGQPCPGQEGSRYFTCTIGGSPGVADDLVCTCY